MSIPEPKAVGPAEPLLDMPDIAFTGKMGSGKSTAASVLTNAGYLTCSFASSLRDIAVKLWGPEARNDRGRLQALGKALREIDEDSLLRPMFEKLRAARNSGLGSRAVLDDLRYPNEWYALKERGFVIVRIEADRNVRVDRLRNNGKLQDEAQLEDPTETALDGDEFYADYTIENNGPWSDFARAVVQMLRDERRRV